MRIPSYSELELMADVSSGVQHDQVYVLEGIEMQSNRVMVAQAVVTAGNCVPVHVLNPTDQDVTLNKGTRIAALAEVEEPDSSVHVSTVQETEGVSPQVEAALWELVKETSLGVEEQDKLFVLLMDYADIFVIKRISWVGPMCFNTEFILETHHLFASNFVECVHKEAGIASIIGGDVK